MVEGFKQIPNEQRELSQLKELYKEQFIELEEVISELGPTLHTIAEEIIAKKPDRVVFIDKSARPFASPYLRFLREKMGDSVPRISFYNDDSAKIAYRDGKSIEPIAQAFDDYADERILFIDETLYSGEGLSALNAVTQHLGIDYHYYAITRDVPDYTEEDDDFLGEVPEEVIKKRMEAENRLNMLLESGRVTVYDNKPHEFLKEIASEYVSDDEENRTISTIGSVHEEYFTESAEDMSEALRYARKEMAYDFVSKVKGKIYQALKEND